MMTLSRSSALQEVDGINTMNLSCLLCYQASPTPVCHWCESDIFFFSPLIHGSNLLGYGPVASHVKHSHYDGLSLLGLHTWPMATLVHQFKFTHSLVSGKVLSHWFVHNKRHCTMSKPDLLLPVPISAWRLAHRHYNQATVIAKHLSKALSIPYFTGWARRKGFGSQHQLTKAARAKHAAQVFALSKKGLDQMISITKQKALTVAIVDDVLTTGVTVNTLSKMLKARYPHINIQVWAMTFTPPPKSTLMLETPLTDKL